MAQPLIFPTKQISDTTGICARATYVGVRELVRIAAKEILDLGARVQGKLVAYIPTRVELELVFPII